MPCQGGASHPALPHHSVTNSRVNCNLFTGVDLQSLLLTDSCGGVDNAAQKIFKYENGKTILEGMAMLSGWDSSTSEKCGKYLSG